MSGLLSMIFGNRADKKPKYPFDIKKAFHQRRGGIMSGGSYIIKTAPEGIVEVYSYPIPVPKYEGGLKDKGADIFYVGIRPGEVTVTATKKFPTCKPESFSFVLVVDENLRVSEKKE